MNMNYKKFIGVYDSGVGGISILKKLKEYLPYEDFLYYGDSANAPYGGKRKDDIILFLIFFGTNIHRYPLLGWNLH